MFMSPSSAKNPSVRFADSWASVRFDLLRGLAAIFVMLGHWRNLVFVDFPEIHAHRWLLAIPYVFVGAGHQSVVLFFVLSGYFIGGTVLRSLERRQWEWPGYLLRRFTRLWMVLVPALLLCLFWDRLGIHLGHAPALYAGYVRNNVISGSGIALRLSPRIFFGNLFFLQTILSPVYGSDVALWSLANEFWYYILFPLGAIALWRTTRIMSRLVCAALFIVVARFVGMGILIAFPLWLVGVALFWLPAPSFTPRTGRYLRIFASLIYAPIFFALGRMSGINGIVSDYGFAVVTFFFLRVLLSDNERYSPTARSVGVSRELARFSYTLYAAHLPFLVFFTALIVGEVRWYPTPVHILAGMGLLFAVFIYSYVLAFITEFRTDALRRRLEKLFGMHGAPPALPSNPLPETARFGPENARTD
jgi:peptidoglycan/LPS O-acetylase OafA/YrhL